MDMIEKNGQPSMEEILASIRRIIAEEPADAISLDFKPRSGTEPGNGAERLNLEDAGDFELPSMFRASAVLAEKNGSSAKLLDALRATPQLDENARASSNHEFPLPALAPVSLINGSETAHQSLSALRPTARAEPPIYETPVLAVSAFAVPAGEFVSSEPMIVSPQALMPVIQEHVPTPNAEPMVRVMTGFKDQHFNRMFGGGASQTPVAAPAPVVATPAPEPTPIFNPVVAAPVQAPSFATLALNSATVPPPLNGAHFNGRSLGESSSEAGSVMPPPQSLSAALQAAEVQVVHSLGNMKPAGIEDATAELLRPMLRQWLSDNMPRMVEKALHIEVAESVKPGKKPGSL
jgi:uncharacterized protein